MVVYISTYVDYAHWILLSGEAYQYVSELIGLNSPEDVFKEMWKRIEQKRDLFKHER